MQFEIRFISQLPYRDSVWVSLHHKTRVGVGVCPCSADWLPSHGRKPRPQGGGEGQEHSDDLQCRRSPRPDRLLAQGQHPRRHVRPEDQASVHRSRLL